MGSNRGQRISVHAPQMLGRRYVVDYFAFQQPSPGLARVVSMPRPGFYCRPCHHHNIPNHQADKSTPSMCRVFFPLLGVHDATVPKTLSVRAHTFPVKPLPSRRLHPHPNHPTQTNLKVFNAKRKFRMAIHTLIMCQQLVGLAAAVERAASMSVSEGVQNVDGDSGNPTLDSPRWKANVGESGSSANRRWNFQPRKPAKTTTEIRAAPPRRTGHEVGVLLAPGRTLNLWREPLFWRCCGIKGQWCKKHRWYARGNCRSA